jgi:hypothetical protein
MGHNIISTHRSSFAKAILLQLGEHLAKSLRSSWMTGEVLVFVNIWMVRYVTFYMSLSEGESCMLKTCNAKYSK